jgi:hypothetical protein
MIFTPAAFMGTRTMLSRRERSGPSSVRTSVRHTDAPIAPLTNHLCPLITQPSPSLRAVVRISVGSEPATSGSVIAKQLRISPSNSGRNQRCCWAAEP